ncbi:MAG: ATP-grasp domain-containing protein [Christensenella sp.]|nr:ATP-grasp domain-containing protein [Christensenella sp.]
METVLAIQSAMEQHGLQTVLLEADPDLPQKLRSEKPDFVFNIAEGSGGRAREAQVPALLNFLQIPFTGSDETALCLALDKALCKRLLATWRVPTPRYRVYSPGAPVRASGLPYPVIVKPNAEGSSKGIPDVCIAEDDAQLRALVQKNFSLYGGDVLAEEYIAGREFTVGLLGNGESVKVFPPMEILYHSSPIEGYRIYNYTVKQEYEKYVSYACPADLLPAQEHEIVRMAKKIFLALGCRDLARVDFRMGENGKIYFIEINPLPGLAPHYSDYPMLAEFCGVPHGELVYQILRAGAERAGVSL